MPHALAARPHGHLQDARPAPCPRAGPARSPRPLVDPETRLDLDALEREAKDRLGAAAYDWYATGAGNEVTLRANVDAWQSLRLRPRVLRDVATVSTQATVLGTSIETPVIVAPMALQRLLHPDGELEMRRAAAAAGALAVFSTRSSTPISDVGAASEVSWWFQVYVLRDRGLTRELVHQAVEGGARALVLTGDTPVIGWKRRPAPGALAVPDDWVMPGLSMPDGMPVRDQFPGNFQDAAITFAEIGWLAGLSGLPVLVKGVLRADDAARCLDAGAAGIVVSNHGGRQLDGVVATAEALPEVVEAVGDAGEVYVDGGIRHGTDVLRAIALGARAVLVGRPVAWGLTVGGAEGAQRVIAGLTLELAEALALVGAVRPRDLTSDLVRGF
jgi:4-hydroxymandelate oxidase